MFRLVVTEQLGPASTRVPAHLAAQPLLAVPQLVATQLVWTVAPVRTHVASVPKVPTVLAHVYGEGRLPLGEVAALGAHVLAHIAMPGHVPRQVA